MNQFKQQFLVLLFFTAPLITFAQVGIGTTDPKAALDVVSTDTGFIMPRVSDHTTLSVGVDQIGMQVYNTTTNSIWFYDGTGWEAISGETQAAVPLWKSSTNDGDYEENDVINYNGVLYKNLTGTNTDTEPDTDTENWITGGVGAIINDGIISTSSAWSSSKIVSEIVSSGNLIDHEGLIKKELISVELESGQVTLTYPQIDAALYHVFYDTVPIHDLTGAGDVTTTQQTVTITGLTNGTTYYFYVKPVIAPPSARVIVRPGTPLEFSSLLTADGVAGNTGEIEVQVTLDPAAGGYKFILTTDGVPTEVVQTGTTCTFSGVARYEQDVAITSATRTSEVTVYNSIAHGIIAGQSILVEGFSNTTFSGDMIVESVSANSFSVYQKGQVDTSESTAALLKKYKTHTLVVESLDDTTAQNSLLASSTLSFNVSEKYFVLNNGGYWAYNRFVFAANYNFYAPRSLHHYIDPTSHNDLIEANTKFAPMVGLRRLPNVLVSPKTNQDQNIPVYAVFDDVSGVYGSTFYLENGDTTSNQMTFSGAGYKTLVIDDNDTTYEDGIGRVGTGSTDQNPYPSESTGLSYFTRTLGLGSYSSLGSFLGTQPTLSTVGERVGQAVMEATNNGTNRNIIVWVDLVNQRFAWRNNGNHHYVTFASLGVTISNSSVRNSLGVVSDGIDTILVGKTSDSNFYTIQFNWISNTAQLMATHSSSATDDDIFNGNATEEDATGSVLHAVNGKIFYLDSAGSSGTWALSGSMYDPNDTNKITHYYNTTGSASQTGTDTLHGTSTVLRTTANGVKGFESIHTDKGHDSSGLFSGSVGSDEGWTHARSNILMIAIGNGVY